MSNNINFFSEEIDFNLLYKEEKITWLIKIATDFNQKINTINYIFCSDDYLLEVNKTHLNHDYYTDIITFDLSENKNIEADIFISIDRVKENAKSLNVSFEKELNRVISHGLLHLLGLNDKTEEEKSIMREKEDSCLSLLKL